MVLELVQEHVGITASSCPCGQEASFAYSSVNTSLSYRETMALEGAIRSIKKTMLPDEVKADLKEFYQCYRK